MATTTSSPAVRAWASTSPDGAMIWLSASDSTPSSTPPLATPTTQVAVLVGAGRHDQVVVEASQDVLGRVGGVVDRGVVAER